MSNTYQIYLISDSTGETLDRIFLALKAQFINIEYKVINKRNLDIGKTYSILPPSQYLPDFWKKDIRGIRKSAQKH